MTGPRRTSPVPRTTFWPFRAHYAGGFFNTRFRLSGAFRGLRRLNSGSTPSCPALRQVLADDACTGLANFALATDWSVVPPRFAPGLSTTHGGVPIGDPDVSPSQTFSGWLSQFSLFTSCHRDHSFCHGAQASGHTFKGELFSAFDESDRLQVKVRAALERIDG